MPWVGIEPDSGKRQLAVSGHALDHTASAQALSGEGKGLPFFQQLMMLMILITDNLEGNTKQSKT